MVTSAQVSNGYGLVILINTVLSCICFKRAVKAKPRTQPKVSILIPARDEEFNLEKNLPFWSLVRYPNLEILVLNDHSEDGTQKVLERFSPQMKIVMGKELPQGWLGKNWACHQLAQQAQGELLIFVDADVTPGQNSIDWTVATLEKYRLSSCSFFLRQGFSNPFSKAVIPWVFQFSLLAWAPHFLSRVGKFSSLVVGNGQWFAVTRAGYSQVGGHEGVKNSVIEDMELSRKLFQAGVAYSAALGPQIAQVSMYRSWSELRAGLNKNLSLILGTSVFGNILFLALYCGVVVTLCFNRGLGLVSVFLSMMLVQLTFGTKKINPLLWFPGLIAAIFLFLQSMVLTRLGKTNWKGREIKI